MQRSLLNSKAAFLTAAFVAAVGVAMCMGTLTANAEPTTSEEAYAELTAQQAKLDTASSNYFAALEDYNDAVSERDDAQARLDTIETELQLAQDRLADRAVELYRSGTGSWLDILLGSTTFSEFTQNLELINIVNMNDAELIQKERDLRDEKRDQEALLEEKVQNASHYADEASKQYQEAQDLVESLQATYEQLSAEEQAYIAQQEAEQQAADQAVADAIAQDGGTVNSDGTITDSSGNTYSSPSEYSSATGSEIVSRAMSQLGANYVWGGVGGSDGGYDCSGFVSYALTGENTRLGTTADFVTWNEVSDPQPGDVCVIHEKNGSQHTGIYIGDGKMVHAKDSKSGVVVSDVQKGMIYVRQ